MDENLNNLLDEIYELEGLMLLALKRSESATDFLRLIKKKGKEIGKKCQALSLSETPTPFNPEHQGKDKQKSNDFPSLSETRELSNLKDDSELNISESVSENMEEDINSDFAFEEYTIDESNNGLTGLELQGKDEYDELSIPSTKEEKKRGRLIFSINDKFRFRKELFENSDVEFNNTLALIASMDSYEEAEEYFLNEEGFDKSNPVVRDFLNIVKKYFQ